MKAITRLFIVCLLSVALNLTLSAAAQEQPVERYFGSGVVVNAVLSPDRSELAVLTTRALIIFPQADPGQRPIYHEFTVDLYGRYTGNTFIDHGIIEYTATGWIITIPAFDDRPSIALAIDRASGAQTPAMPRPDGLSVHSAAGRYNLLIPTDLRTVGVTLEHIETGVITTILPPSSPAIVLGYGLNRTGTRVMAAYRTANSPGVLRIWDTASGTLLHEVTLERQRGVAVALDDQIAIDQGQGIQILSFDGTPLSEPIALEGMLLPTTGGLVTVQPRGDTDRLTALTIDESGSRVRTIDTPACSTRALKAFIVDDALIIVRPGISSTISRYSLESGTLLSAAGGFGMPNVDLARDGQGRLLSAQSAFGPYLCDRDNPGNGVVLYQAENAVSGELLPTEEPPFEIAAVDDLLVVSQFARRVDIYQGGQPAASLSVPSLISELALNDRYLAAVMGDEVLVWSLQSLWTMLMRFTLPIASGQWGDVLQLTGDLLLVAGPQSVQFIDLRSGQAVRTLSLDAQVSDIQVADGRLAVITTPEPGLTRVHLFELSDTTTTPITTVDLDRDYRGGALSPDGRLLAVSQPNGDFTFPGTVVIDTASGAVVRSIDRMALPVIFSSDGAYLIGADAGLSHQNKVGGILATLPKERG
jgi:hypothetical protein